MEQSGLKSIKGLLTDLWKPDSLHCLSVPNPSHHQGQVRWEGPCIFTLGLIKFLELR